MARNWNGIDGMARTLWLYAYMEYAENTPGVARARSGQDWDDIAPKTPAAAYKAAWALVELIEESNRTQISMLAMMAAAEDEHTAHPAGSRRRARAKGIDMDDFGSALASMALGSGVSWFDNHARFHVSIPNFEVSFDGTSFSWDGGSVVALPNPAPRRNPPDRARRRPDDALRGVKPAEITEREVAWSVARMRSQRDRYPDSPGTLTTSVLDDLLCQPGDPDRERVYDMVEREVAKLKPNPGRRARRNPAPDNNPLSDENMARMRRFLASKP
jgi:hypothetical protein